MPIFFQHRINPSAQLAIWKIEEPITFFEKRVGKANSISHQRVALRHLAGRFLLTELDPTLLLSEIKITDTGKPYLPDSSTHFSISHTGNDSEDYAAVIISKDNSVGIDIEFSADRILKVANKFLSDKELNLLQEYYANGVDQSDLLLHPFWKKALTASWSIKESVFKWQGISGIDFKEHILLQAPFTNELIHCTAVKSNREVVANFKYFNDLCLSWVNH